MIADALAPQPRVALVLPWLAGRPAAVLGPVAPRTWRRWDELADVFREPFDATWETDRDLLDSSPVDPWEPR